MKRFSIQIILRIIGIVLNAILIAWIFGDTRLFFNQVILASVLALQIWELIHYVNFTNREIARLFLAIKHADFSISFNDINRGKSFKQLHKSMTEIIESYRDVKIEKEAQYHFLQQLVNQIQIGIISLQDDTILLMNPVAEKILGVTNIKNWQILRQQNPDLAGALEAEGKKLVEVKSSFELKILAAEISSLTMIGKPYKLITIQDINSEIEQKEIEAWHKLIRILTHEIMNSVTPISSLSETMQSMLRDRDGKQKMLGNLQDETIHDILFSLTTIQKRSESLLDFVDSYRKLTRVPKPQIAPVTIKSWVKSLQDLMHDELTRQSIALQVHLSNENEIIAMDATLMEQVIINLLQNSIHALENRPIKRIDIKCYREEKTFVIEVSDTGKGIPDKELKEIFIPFFSTKKEGSGIGLSLSKQILSLHGGRIRVQSTPEEGTTFYLVLPLDPRR